MGEGVQPGLYRPLFDHLRLVTCRTFETPAANTIPLFAQDAAFVEEIYGPEARRAGAAARSDRRRRSWTCWRGPTTIARSSAGIRRHLASDVLVPGAASRSSIDLMRN